MVISTARDIASAFHSAPRGRVALSCIWKDCYAASALVLTFITHVEY
jgi:hypothetical protein